MVKPPHFLRWGGFTISIVNINVTLTINSKARNMFTAPLFLIKGKKLIIIDWELNCNSRSSIH